MLDTFRKQSRSIIIYVFFGIIIAVFVINFGPQSQGCGPSQTYAARVARATITENDFRYALVVSGADRVPVEQARAARVRETIMDKLIERELLAQEAERMGFRASDQEVNDLISSGRIMALGVERDVRPLVFRDEAFDYELLRRFCLYQVGTTVQRFVEHQQRELLADKVRQLAQRSVRVSEEEARRDYLDRQLQVDLDYVRLSPRLTWDQVEVGDAEVDALLAKDADKVKERYHTRKFLWSGVPRQARIRRIRLDLPGAAAQAQKQRARAAALVERIRAGEDFAALALAESADDKTRASGGDLGWRARGETGLGDDLDKRIFAAKEGDVIGPVEQGGALHVVRVEGFREGDLPFEAVGREVADNLLREEKATAALREEAEALLARLRAGEPWERLFASADADDDKAEDEKADDAKAKKDERPAPATAHTYRSTGLFDRRRTVVPGLGVAPELMRGAFRLSREAPLGAKVYEVGGTLFLIRLKERVEPDPEDFEGRKAEIVATYRGEKAGRAAAETARALCDDARPRVNPALVAYGDGRPTSYEPCATLGLQ